jgi:hypothetical protein
MERVKGIEPSLRFPSRRVGEFFWVRQPEEPQLVVDAMLQDSNQAQP